MEHLNKIKVAAEATKNGLISGMRRVSQMGTTQNGALTFTSTDSALLDFYAQAGAMRPRPEQALDLFKKAFAEDREKAVKILFYLRDVRGGQGERDLFRTCLEWLGTDVPEVFEQIVQHISVYGRWDDLFFDHPKCFEVIDEQLAADNVAEHPSLLAKWMPTINASSPKTRAKAKIMATRLNLSEIEYRKHIRKLREKIATVEEQMSANEWGGINYSAVPSQASRIYKNAFKKHDESRYEAFINRAVEGEEKINAATLYPYQIYKSVQNDYSKTLEALWKQLPDYTQGKNALVIADVSGSMTGDPMSVAVSLALYFAERNKGQFQDHFMTFTTEPRLQRVVGKTLLDRMNSIEDAERHGSTDLQAAFDLVLESALVNRVPEYEMPDTLYIISDMEFNSCVRHETNFSAIERKYEEAGYKLPNVVFWQVNGSGRNTPVQKDKSGVALVSGFSPVIFKIAVENKTPLQIMEETINSPRYEPIKVV